MKQRPSLHNSAGQGLRSQKESDCRGSSSTEWIAVMWGVERELGATGFGGEEREEREERGNGGRERALSLSRPLAPARALPPRYLSISTPSATPHIHAPTRIP